MNKKIVNNMVYSIREIVLENILKNNLILNNDKIIVAVSGGPDSICLLDVLTNLKSELKEKHNINYDLFVAHVNHKIRKESDEEKIYVESVCKNHNIPFYYKEADILKISKEMKISEETCGRYVRYEFFNEILSNINASKIAVAHNMDDNVETIFLNIIRGSGIKGLIGMNFLSGNIIRPILNIQKSDILEYCELEKLDPCFDATNELDIYKRNKIRLKLIPSIKNEYNENIVQNIIRMSKIAKIDNDFMDSYSENIVKKCILNADKETITFDFSIILNEHEAVQNRVIRNIIFKNQGNLEGIEQIHVSDIQKLFTNNIKGKKYIIGNKFTIEIVKKNIAIIY
ncbi:MAG: tRNA lysidine(34) synthetase TilS [Clostridia bacterium]|nr:tRNA lysidine(34) synthetase TilS [Clostridia bacterium]